MVRWQETVRNGARRKRPEGTIFLGENVKVGLQSNNCRFKSLTLNCQAIVFGHRWLAKRTIVTGVMTSQCHLTTVVKVPITVHSTFDKLRCCNKDRTVLEE